MPACCRRAPVRRRRRGTPASAAPSSRRWRGFSGSKRTACLRDPAPPAPPPAAGAAGARPQRAGRRATAAAATGSDHAADRRRGAHPAPRRAGGRPRRAAGRRRSRSCALLADDRSGSAADGGVRARAHRRRERAAIRSIAALADPSRSCRAAPPKRSGSIGDTPAADADRRRWSAAHVQAGALDAAARRRRRCAPRYARRGVRLGMYALVRLKAYDAARGGASSTPAASRASAGGRWPTPCSGSRIKRALPALLTLLQGDGIRTPARLRRKGLGAHQGTARRCRAGAARCNAASARPCDRRRCARSAGSAIAAAAGAAADDRSATREHRPDLRLEAVDRARAAARAGAPTDRACSIC